MTFQPFDDSDFSPEDYTDSEAEEFLKHIHHFVACHQNETFLDDTISNIAEDLAMSMDPTTDAADWYRRRIEFWIGGDGPEDDSRA